MYATDRTETRTSFIWYEKRVFWAWFSCKDGKVISNKPKIEETKRSRGQNETVIWQGNRNHCQRVYSRVSETTRAACLAAVDIFTLSSILVAWEEVMLTMSFVQKNREELHCQRAPFSLCPSDDDCLWSLKCFDHDRKGQPCLLMPLMAWFPNIKSHKSFYLSLAFRQKGPEPFYFHRSS